MIQRDFHLTEKTLFKRSALLKLSSDEALPVMLPGQFAQVRVDGSSETYLRRPISIHNVVAEKNEVWLLVQKAGRGTETLCDLPTGATVNIVLPLGKSFTLPCLRCSCQATPSHYLLVGGGVGIAPLLFLAKTLREQYAITPVCLLGGRSESDMLQLDLFRQYGEVYLTTEDASAGVKGFVTDHPILQQMAGTEGLQVCCCGPKPMMMAVARWAKASRVSCEVSLENLMACGLGACLCCVEKTVDGQLCVCKEGPVFNINQLLW